MAHLADAVKKQTDFALDMATGSVKRSSPPVILFICEKLAIAGQVVVGSVKSSVPPVIHTNNQWNDRVSVQSASRTVANKRAQAVFEVTNSEAISVAKTQMEQPR